jgi:hypothetical protein
MGDFMLEIPVDIPDKDESQRAKNTKAWQEEKRNNRAGY